MNKLNVTFNIGTKSIILMLILFLYSFASTLSAQEKKVIRMQKPSGSYEILTEEGEIKFPFELIRNQIVVPVEIDGCILKLILDSGMPADGILLFGSKRIDNLKLQYVGKASVMGVGGKSIEADLAMGETLSFPGIKLKNQMVIVMPKDTIRSLHFEGKDGIIGFAFFSRFVVKIDFDSKKISLLEPEKFQYSGSGQEYKVTVTNNRIFTPVELKINPEVSVSADLVLDTGSSTALSLNASSNKDIIVPDKLIMYKRRSINEDILSSLGRISNVQLAGFTFENVLCSFKTMENEMIPPWEKEGNLGMELLRRFNLIFNIPNKLVILEPNNYLNEPFEFNMAGFQFIRTKKGYFKITHVISDSPASQSELKEGDQIVSINGKPSEDYTYDELDYILSQEEELVKLLILSKGKEKEVQILLHRLI